MEGLELQEIGGGARGGGGAFSVPENVGRIVGAGPDGCLGYIQKGAEDIMMGNITAKFQVAVGDGASGVGEGSEVAANRAREALAPQARLGAGGGGEEEDTTHACASGVASTNNRRSARY